MFGFQPRGKRPPLPAGMIKGPGTGTSDSIKTEVPVGSYIMPADSTATLGEDALAQMGARGFNPERLEQIKAARARASGGAGPDFSAKGLGERAVSATTAEEAPGLGFKPKDVPVNLSNGEYQMPPEQVHAVGVKVLDQIKDATHAPSGARGFKVQDGDLYFADGGAVAESTDELLARIQAKYGTGGSSSASPQPQAPVQRPAAPAPVPAPTIAGAVGALQNRRQQIDAAAGYADGGAVQPVRGLGFGPTSVGARMLNGRQSFADGGDVEDPEKPRAVAGAPGVVREGNTYSAASRGLADVTFSDVTARSPKLPSQVRFDEPRLPDAVMKRFEELQKPGMTLRVQGKELAEPGKVMASIEPKTDTPAAASPATARVPAAKGFDPSALTLLQRDAAGDTYRTAWQREAPGGVRNADGPGLGFYNAEQQVRGTGIAAQRDANGRMSFSGDGSNALPQNYARGFDLNIANQIQARANAIRGETVALQQRMTDDANFARGVTGARKTTPEERRELAEIQTDRDRRSATYNQNRLQEEFARARFAGDGRAMENIATQMALVGKQQTDIRDDVRAREVAGDELAQQRADAANRNALDSQRLGLEQQRVGSEVAERGFNINRLERMERLQQQYEAADTPEKRAALAEQFRVFSGKEAPKQDTVLTQERMKTVADLFKAYNERMPVGPDDKTPIPFEQWAAPALRLISGLSGGGAESVRALPQGMAPAEVRAAAQRQIANGIDRRLVEARLAEYGLSLGEG